jgi:hypothetical protein
LPMSPPRLLKAMLQHQRVGEDLHTAAAD